MRRALIGTLLGFLPIGLLFPWRGGITSCPNPGGCTTEWVNLWGYRYPEWASPIFFLALFLALVVVALLAWGFFKLTH
jgi:hypothetical protein